MPIAPSRNARIILVGILLATVLTAFTSRDLWSPDEQRYGQVPREMMEGGDWLVMHLGSKPYAEKPPVFFWAVALLSAPTGEVTAFTTRLTGCLGCALAIFTLWVLTRRWFGREDAATAAAAIFATNVWILHNGTRATMDLALTAFILLAVERGSQWLRHGGAWRGALFGLFVAAGALTKGPMGLVLPLFAFAGEAVGLGRTRARLGLGWLVPPVVAAVVGLAWLLPALRAGGDAYEARLLGQIVSRTTGTERANVHGAIWLAGVLLAAGLPWMIHMGVGAVASLTPRRSAPGDRAGLLAAAGGGLLGIGLLFLSATKREVYIIPMLPFVAAAAGGAMASGRFARPLRAATVMAVGAPLAGALLTLGLAFVGDRFVIARQPWPDTLFDAGRFLALLPALLVFVGGFAWAWPTRFDAMRAAGRVGLVLAVGVLLLKAGLFPDIDQRKSFREVARIANEVATPAGEIAAGPGIVQDWLWNLDRRRIQGFRTLEGLADVLGPEGGAAAAIVAGGWWEDGLARLRARIAAAEPDEAAILRALERRLDALVLRGEAQAEHRIFRILAPAP